MITTNRFGQIDFDGRLYHASLGAGLATPHLTESEAVAAIERRAEREGTPNVRILAGKYPWGTRRTGSIIV